MAACLEIGEQVRDQAMVVFDDEQFNAITPAGSRRLAVRFCDGILKYELSDPSTKLNAFFWPWSPSVNDIDKLIACILLAAARFASARSSVGRPESPG